MNLEKLTNSENSEILNGLSSVVNFTKTKTAKALAAGSIFLTATALSTGIFPVQRNIAGVEINNIEEAQACQPWWRSKPRYAWWGIYYYLDRCQAQQAADNANVVSYFVGGAAAKGSAAAALASSYTGYLGHRIGYCERTAGQAYLRFNWAATPLYRTVSCY